MEIQLEKGPDSARLALAGELSIYSAAEAKPQLLDASRVNKRLDVDLSQVSELDVAGLQLIVMMLRESRAQGNHLRLVSHSAAVGDVLMLCNLENLMDMNSCA